MKTIIHYLITIIAILSMVALTLVVDNIKDGEGINLNKVDTAIILAAWIYSSVGFWFAVVPHIRKDL